MEKIVVLCLFASCLGNAIKNPIVELEDGKIQGISETTDSGKMYYAFKEIPYAMPPVGNFRFAEPNPPKKWKGVLKTTKITKICMQRKPPTNDPTPDPKENEDCLYIHVFTPKILGKNETELLPVYVYIFGGMMISGDPTDYNFQGFIDENIVVVSMNYRVSTLGFLGTDDGVIPGNLGLKDQTFGLKWVNKNIKQFGGDPSKVTIGGHSSGAISVGFHILNTKSNGLFRAAILQSASPLNFDYFLNATEVAYSFAERFDPDIHSKNTTQLLNLLRNIPADILTRVDHIKRPEWLESKNMLFQPAWAIMVENPKFQNAVVIGPMYENVENGLTNHVPVLTGFTNEEVVVLNLTPVQESLDKNVSNIVNPSFNVKPENRLKLAKEIKNLYTQTNTFKENMTALIQMTSDLLFCRSITNFVKLHSKFADVYLYQFSYGGPLNGLDERKKNELFKMSGLGTVSHTKELPYIYYFQLNSKVVPSENDLLTRKRLLRLWTNFIKHLNPTPKPEPLLQDVIWPEVKPNDVKYMDISETMSIKENPRRFTEWEHRVEKYIERPRYI